ncbi:MAG: hypothetical protein RL369_140, partial [Pseudomonadota bacterium]
VALEMHGRILTMVVWDCIEEKQ